jgi:hypothetical protein
MPQSIQGVVINEILADPNGVNGDFDTDGNGFSETSDEYVELYNTTASDVDLSGWTFTDGDGITFTFPAGALIPANGHVLLINQWTTSPVPDYVYETGIGLNNSGDEAILSDGTTTIAAVYNAENPTDIPPGALVDDFGTDSDGFSIQRSPDGSDTLTVAAPSPQCFAAGTAIATPTGEAPVETLAEGDLVLTEDGRSVCVKWIGRQTLHRDRLGLRSQPVRIRANALGTGIPHCDLTVTADHGMVVQNHLINASALVNHETISFVPLAELETEFTVFHIETAAHEVLLANGAPSESFIDYCGRKTFDNFADYLSQNGAEALIHEMPLPRVSSARHLPQALRDLLFSKAESVTTTVA